MDTSTESASSSIDLSNYVPFGCLVLDVVDRHLSCGEWKAYSVLPHAYLAALHKDLHGPLSKLLAAGWVAVNAGCSTLDPRLTVLRIFVLPNDHEVVDRGNARLESALFALVQVLDVSAQTWNGAGRNARFDYIKFDPFAIKDDRSLFYLFNKIPSPKPDPSKLSDSQKYAREAMEDLLNPTSAVLGLRSTLYPYQRRSAALMLQREACVAYELDPRQEQRTAPDGSTFYYSPRTFPLQICRSPTYHEACRGGILAETMGLGKTCILLALILATKHQPSKIPRNSLPLTRNKVGSLSDMAVASLHRQSLPWQVEFQRIEFATGDSLRGCRSKLEARPHSYQIPQMARRRNRNTVQPLPKTLFLSATTIIVVPQNLLQQWTSEFRKHVEDGGLKVLIMDQASEPLPPPKEICSYDAVLFTRNRFEQEDRDGSSRDGRRFSTTQLECRCPYIGATRTRDCHCLRASDLYHSPLKAVHFKRLVIDEGHFFSSKDSRAAQVANSILTVDHRWVVSGTPAKDLMGVEVDIAAYAAYDGTDVQQARERALAQRGTFDSQEDVNGAIKSLGSLATHFLKIQPWVGGPDERADWADCIYRHADMKRRTYSAYSACLQRTLSSIVVKTQMEDVEKDITLPPLESKIVRLEPSFFDKLTANLFTLVLTANAVTSERTDADYLFHKNSGKARNQLITNLRQSAAIWTGFGEAEVTASIKVSTGYLAKEDTNCSILDRTQLEGQLKYAEMCLTNDGWKGLSRTHELGVFVEHWPTESAEHWSFVTGEQEPILTGITQALEAQRYVNERADQPDPTEGLAGTGIRALAAAGHATAANDSDASMLKGSIPTSSLNGEPDKRSKKTSPKKGAPQAAEDRPKRSRKRRFSELETATLPESSPLRKSQVVGTTSAKISYLISRIIELYGEEKILVFFDGDNVAYYLAQLLELLNIQHEIYAKALHAKTKAEYVVRFNEQPEIRVLLMDVKQAAFGLNICAASRVFFINPVCQPSVEAQAIKRAHRIGQTRPVYVETLVLRGSLEEKMLERSQAMTRHEHQDARSLADDSGMREIIQSATAIEISYEEAHGESQQMAPLSTPQQLFSRSNWQDVLQWGPRKAEFERSTKRRKSIFDSLGERTEVVDLTDPEVLAQFSTRTDDATASTAGQSMSSGRLLQFVEQPNAVTENEQLRRDSTPVDTDEPPVRRKLRFADSVDMMGREDSQGYPTPPEESEG